MSENLISRRGLLKGTAGAAAAVLVVERLSSPALAVGAMDPANKAHAELAALKKHFKEAAEQAARNTAKKFVKVASIMGGPQREFDDHKVSKSLFLWTPATEELPRFDFAYIYDGEENSNYVKITETNGDPAHGGWMVEVTLGLPNTDNVIYDKIAAGLADEVTAEDARDVVDAARHGMGPVIVTSPEINNDIQAVYFQDDGVYLFYGTNYHLASPHQINYAAAAVRQVDHSPALSISAPDSV